MVELWKKEMKSPLTPSVNKSTKHNNEKFINRILLHRINYWMISFGSHAHCVVISCQYNLKMVIDTWTVWVKNWQINN